MGNSPPHNGMQRALYAKSKFSALRNFKEELNVVLESS